MQVAFKVKFSRFLKNPSSHTWVSPAAQKMSIRPRSGARPCRGAVLALLACWTLGATTSASALAQAPGGMTATSSVTTSGASDATKTTVTPPPVNTSPPAAKVDVAPLAHDDEIQARLTKILRVAGLIENPQVKVKDGVVFLTGRTALDANKQWAGDLARNTEDVVAVVNHLEVVHGAIWDFSPAFDSLKQMEINLVRSLPLIASGLLILALAYAAAIMATRWMRRGLENRVYAPLLREVFARCAGFLVLIIGLYITLRIANLTHLALTIMGGTGLLGLVLGIAFGNITENFLASILLSMQQPFRVGDLVRIEDTLGYVQRLTTRTTVITTVDGNEVQIPNATIYKSVIRNFSTMPNSRVDFTLSVPRAHVEWSQQAAIKVITEHPLVLHEPEPSVLIDSATDATATLKAYFWINGRENSWLKVRSSVMRLVLHAIDQVGDKRLPSESAREQSRITNGKKHAARRSSREQTVSSSTAVATKAEGDMSAEGEAIKEQAQEACPDDGENLLSPKEDASTASSEQD